MKLLVCGSRVWGVVPSDVPPEALAAEERRAKAERERVRREIAALAPFEVIHGAAPGADTTAAHEAVTWALNEERGLMVTPYPANWERDGKAAGPIRNARMLREGKPERGLSFGALWKRGRVANKRTGAGWRLTGTGHMVSLMLRAELPVRWVAAHDAPAVDLLAMPEPDR